MHMAQQDSRDEDLMIQMISSTDHDARVQDPLDDVFGSDAGSPTSASHHPAEARTESHPSDVRRLQAEHATAGYRDGISAAKATSIQAGFDEGFGLGATIGLKAGQTLGLLEGIVGALRARGGEGGANGDGDGQYRRVRGLLEDARRDLGTEMIFDQRYWAPDGTWTYELVSDAPEGEVVFEHVADAHPLISKWNAVIAEELGRWQIRRDILDSASEVTTAAPEKKPVKIERQEMMEW